MLKRVFNTEWTSSVGMIFLGDLTMRGGGEDGGGGLFVLRSYTVSLVSVQVCTLHDKAGVQPVIG